MSKFYIFFIFILIITTKTNALTQYKNYYILNCIDGDTLKVSKDGRKIMTVRVLGVDTFESRKNRQAQRQAKEFNLFLDQVIEIGRRAKLLCTENWLKKEVNLNCWKKDKYERDLCWVYSEDLKDYSDYMITNKVGYYVKPY